MSSRSEPEDIHEMIARMVAERAKHEPLLPWKMDPEKKAIWTQALRSGWFKQGKECLWDQRTDTYCCLGVYGYLSEAPPRDLIRAWLNFDEIPSDVQGVLAHLNDKGLPFVQIADWVDENL